MSNYGTLPQQTNQQSNNANNALPSDEEHASLLSTTQTPSLSTRLQTHLTTPISTTWTDIPLLSCYLITGLLDSSATSTWGAFVSMQTGNTVYLGLGVFSPTAGSSDRWARGLIAIAAFCFGSYIFSRFHRYFGGRKRWVIVCSYLFQLLFILAAALMTRFDPSSEPPKERRIDVFTALPLGLLAFQAGGQAVISRVLGFGALTSVVLTSIYCDLWSDEKVLNWKAKDPERNRRAAAVVLLLLGAIAGGAWERSSIGLQGALWTAVGLKGVLVGVWWVWKGEKRSES